MASGSSSRPRRARSGSASSEGAEGAAPIVLTLSPLAETPLSVAVCSGAPCYNNKKSDGPLNVTCLCPVYPYDEANHTFGLIPP